MLDSREKLPSRLIDAAGQYLARGWSVLPLRGDADPRRPKAPAMAWQRLQQRPPAADDLPGWFESGKAAALGIVCGRVSRLAVLDLDDAEAARAFASCCPELLDTWTVRSGGRGQPHYYFEVPAEVALRGGRAPGVDLQFDGSYVLAPPTCIGGRHWQVIHDAEALSLDQAGADVLTAFVSLWRLRHAGGPAATLNGSEVPVTLPGGELEVEALRGWYRRLAVQGGRNRALFRAASLARDCGWSRERAGEVLTPVHVVQAPAGPHAPESAAQRRREAERTIMSAWRRARRRSHSVRARRGLPNVLRESLLGRGEVAAARVLDAVLLLGIRGGRLLSERALCRLVEGFGIGRRSVQQALLSRLPDGALVFASPRNPPTALANAAVDDGTYLLPCESVRGAGRVKRGRPPRLYRVPTPARLLQRLKLRDGGSDVLQGRDLRSPQAYRCALHRSLIERRPGLYSRRWLGARLGVSVWTSRRYDRRAGLKVEARYRAAALDEQLLKRLPAAAGNAGCFLESGDRRRWPALRGLAQHLLQRYGQLRYLRQGWNHYALSAASEPAPSRPDLQRKTSATLRRIPAASVTGVTVASGKAPPERICEKHHKQQAAGVPPDADRSAAAGNLPERQKALRYWHCATCGRGGFCERRPEFCPACSAAAVETVAPEVWRDPERCRAWWSKRQEVGDAGESGGVAPQGDRSVGPAAADLALARQLCQATRSRGAGHALSFATARQLLRSRGPQALRRVLRMLERRRDIRNPGGFVVALLGGSRRNGERERRSQEEWLAALRASPMAAYIEC